MIARIERERGRDAIFDFTRLERAVPLAADEIALPHGVLTVHFAGLPPGTSALLVKFVPPETLARFGGAPALAKAIAGAVDQLGPLVADPDRLRRLRPG